MTAPTIRTLADFTTAMRHMSSLFEHDPTGRDPSLRRPSIEWWALALCGEAGELANQAKKIWRDDDGQITPERREHMLDELGDVFAYASDLADALGSNAGEVINRVYAKNIARFQRGTLQGDGDDR